MNEWDGFGLMIGFGIVEPCLRSTQQRVVTCCVHETRPTLPCVFVPVFEQFTLVVEAVHRVVVRIRIYFRGGRSYTVPAIHA